MKTDLLFYCLSLKSHYAFMIRSTSKINFNWSAILPNLSKALINLTFLNKESKIIEAIFSHFYFNPFSIHPD